MTPFGQKNMRDSEAGREQPRDLPATRVIPYEYVARFTLTGNVGNLIQDVINISVEGVFVAVSIGYGFDENRAEPLTLPAPEPLTPPASGPPLGQITLDDIPPDVLIEGFRISPSFATVAVQNGKLKADLPFEVARLFFERLKQTENFAFLFSIVDTATGRELQNEPVHSVATLGRADGRRPFKMLPQPMVFMPRSTIRLQIEERMKGASGRLFITLQGYKLLGVAGEAEDAVRKLGQFDPLTKIPVYDHETGSYRTLGEAIDRDIATSKVVPFDYVSTLDLSGKPGNIVDDEVPINVDGGYMATALGYSLDPGSTSVEIERGDDLIDLKSISLAQIKPVQALFDGIRIHPIRVKFAFGGDGRLASASRDLVGRMFQRINRPEDVRFLYSITDSGTGREIQNQRVHNVASLGIG
ncbi:MAG TPA: hypothetical protein VK747_19730, partial [Blastocatellia bacterium]|nr:hypothetical protein [Blastocatellia bacterium]